MRTGSAGGHQYGGSHCVLGTSRRAYPEAAIQGVVGYACVHDCLVLGKARDTLLWESRWRVQFTAVFQHPQAPPPLRPQQQQRR